MKRPFHLWGASLALLGVLNAATFAAAPASRDLTLTEDGRLQGQVYRGNGAAARRAKVTLTRHGAKPDEKSAVVSTDQQGRFSFDQVAPGLYDLSCAKRGGTVRIWRAAVAPPRAHDAAMIVVGDVQRGQFGRGGGLFNNPLWLTGLVVAAIAVPLALDDDSGS